MKAMLHVQKKDDPETPDSRLLESQTMYRLVLPSRQQGTLLCPSMPKGNSSNHHEELVHRELCEELVLTGFQHVCELI